MAIWDIFGKSGSPPGLHLFEVAFPDGMAFGVTAASAEEAEAIVCEQIFHNQTIPGLPVVNPIPFDEAKKKFQGVPLKEMWKKGVWYRG